MTAHREGVPLLPAREITSLASPGTVDALADALVERLRPSLVDERLVDAATLAEILGVERSWVYAHAAELGAYRLGDGPKAPLRFSPREVLEAARSRSGSEGSQEQESPAVTGPKRARRRRAGGSSARLLPVRGQQTDRSSRPTSPGRPGRPERGEQP